MTKFVVDIWLDGYDNQAEHDAACVEALNDAWECLGGAASGSILMQLSDDVELPKESTPITITLNKMLYVSGSKTAFRCTCGANVFSHMKDDDGEYYECHGCHTIYRGEKDDDHGI